MRSASLAVGVALLALAAPSAGFGVVRGPSARGASRFPRARIVCGPRVRIVAVGRDKQQGWLSDAVDVYLSRLRGTLEVEMVWVRDDAALVASVQKAAASRGSEAAILLDERGAPCSSAEFATRLYDGLEAGGSRLVSPTPQPEPLTCDAREPGRSRESAEHARAHPPSARAHIDTRPTPVRRDPTRGVLVRVSSSEARRVCRPPSRRRGERGYSASGACPTGDPTLRIHSSNERLFTAHTDSRHTAMDAARGGGVNACGAARVAARSRSRIRWRGCCSSSRFTARPRYERALGTTRIERLAQVYVSY